ncbi:MAG: hypothetical protein AB1716_06170 [Planctomycetota bacterium]
MEPTPELIDELYREEIRDARCLSPGEKMRIGGELFEAVCERMRDGIRFQFPEADGERVEAILGQRLELARRLEQGP